MRLQIAALGTMFASTRQSRSGLLCLLSGALLAGAQVVVVMPAQAVGGEQIRLNEVLFNPLGTDRGQEFVEVAGPPGMSLEGVSLVVLEGDATATSQVQKGRVDNVLDLGPYSLGSGGLILLRDGFGIIDCDPGPDVGGPLLSTQTVLFMSSATQSGFGNTSVGLENSSSTFLLVRGFSGAVGQDLDTNNDGALDVLPWTQVLDAVSVINSSSGPITQAVGYAPEFGGATFSSLVTGFEIPMLVRRSDGSWITAPIIGSNPTTGPPTSLDSGPYFWQPGNEYPHVGGAQYVMSPGQPNGPIPNGQLPCGSLRVVAGEGTNSLWSTWGLPTFDLDGSPVQFPSPPGSTARQGVGAAVRASFTASIGCRYRFDLCLSEIDDTVMVALETCGDPSTAFAVNDESPEVCGSGSSTSSLDLNLGAGQTVELAVGTFMYANDVFPVETGSLVLRIRRDSDSDGTLDEDDACPLEPTLTAPRTYQIDADGDGYGGGSVGSVCATSPPTGYSVNGGDCNDGSAFIRPGAAESCADVGTDNDCDGDTTDVSNAPTFFLDADGDGAGDSAITIQACQPPPGYVAVGGDGCPLNPFAQAPVRWHRDLDNDLFGDPAVFIVSCVQPAGHIPQSTDCDDTRSSVNPQQQERCDPLNLDEDCDGVADDFDTDAIGRTPWFLDVDGDGFGTGSPDPACDAPSNNHVAASGDCDDARAAAYPGALELCATAGVDNDCDGDVYETDADAADRATWYSDADGDGTGDANLTRLACTQPDGYVSAAGDQCPSNGALTAPLPYFVDSDGDGYGTDAAALFCDTAAPTGHSTRSGDCNDDEIVVNPGASETCNGVDDDCAGGPDDGLEFRDYYIDSDGDGYGEGTDPLSRCASPGDSWVERGGDGCPQDPAKIAPGACGCGSADTDGDLDGVADCIDNCTDEYNPVQGDCNNDGYGDACEIASGSPDCNQNARPDGCDIALGASSDVDANSQPDECQPDCNDNALPDAWETAQDLADDCNENGLPDECEDGSIRDDTGNMGALYASATASSTLSGHTTATTLVHVRIDVLADMAASDAYLTIELNGSVVAPELRVDGTSGCPKAALTFSIDLSVAQWAQVIAAAESPGSVRVALIASAGVGTVPCANGASRVRVSYGGSGYDCDGDGASDLCQLAAGDGDCDANGIYDACETGGPGDTDSDGIPDGCERARGDFNLDGTIDGSDLSFVLSAWGTLGNHPGDLDGDGEVAGEDLATLLAAWGLLEY